MSYFCAQFIEGNDPNDIVDWYRADSWCRDESDAVIDFMEQSYDPEGEFGIGNSDVERVYVLVYNQDREETVLFSVLPNPRPGYYKDDLDEYDTKDLLGVDEYVPANGPRPPDYR